MGSDTAEDHYGGKRLGYEESGQEFHSAEADEPERAFRYFQRELGVHAGAPAGCNFLTLRFPPF
jgi:hypothetical protein